MTATEFAALPEGPPHSQLIEGELFFTPSPNRLHQDIIGNVAFSIETHLRTHPGLGWVYIGPSDVKLDEGNIFEPDVYLVSREREGILTDLGATGAPDIVVEVFSPSTLRLDREKKRAVYSRPGGRELWFVLPDHRKVEVHLPVMGVETVRTLSTGDALTTEVLPGWSSPVEDLFG